METSHVRPVGIHSFAPRNKNYSAGFQFREKKSNSLGFVFIDRQQFLRRQIFSQRGAICAVLSAILERSKFKV